MPRSVRSALHNARSFSWTLNRRYLSMYTLVVSSLSNDLISRENGRGREGLADGVTHENRALYHVRGENVYSIDIKKDGFAISFNF